MNYYLHVLKNYTNFSGRARRKEYWMFFLFNMIFAIVAMVLDNILNTKFTMNGIALPYGWVYLIYGLAVMLPGLAVAVRRLHDIGKSGWMFFIVLIPIAGGIWLLVLVCTEGTRGDNQYGPDPKAEEQV
jgi:uncharacterized membrane protein YhaH (DUF805 family)